MAEIKKIFKEFGMEEVKLTFVIVSKRINTKFFKGLENPLSGKICVVFSSVPFPLFDPQERSWTVWSLCRRDTTTS